ncbi:MAG: hypothetical protein ABI682_15855, partial [Acidobacteriota bacterium]
MTTASIASISVERVGIGALGPPFGPIPPPGVEVTVGDPGGTGVTVRVGVEVGEATPPVGVTLGVAVSVAVAVAVGVDVGVNEASG